MAVETSLPWPSNIPELKRLDEFLRCGICYEFMSTSMVTVCSHNFCSLCIRQYLGYKTQCPACFQETTSQQLRNNRLLDEIITIFPGLRDKVARQCQSSKGNTISGYLKKDEDGNDGSGAVNGEVDTPSILGTPQIGRSPNVRTKLRDKDFPSSPAPGTSSKDLLLTPRTSKTPGLEETPKRTPTSFLKSPTSVSSSPSSYSKLKSSSLSLSQSQSSSSAVTQSGRQSVSGFFSILGDRSNSDSLMEEDKVPCPVCSVKVPERNINLHLDACLKRMDENQKEEIICVTRPPKRKPLPKLVYSLLSDKQMRQMLKEIGLPVQGDKQQLANRHRKYTTLYNVECDAVQPRPVSEIIRQVEREEKEETKGTITKSIFTYDRKTPTEIIEKEQIGYLKKNENHFSTLIADVKRRQEEARKKKMQESTADKSTSDNGLPRPGPSKTNVNCTPKSKVLKSMHQVSSSENSDSDSEGLKVKASSKGNTTKKNNTILNFFQNSPRKSNPSLSEAQAAVSPLKQLSTTSCERLTGSTPQRSPSPVIFSMSSFSGFEENPTSLASVKQNNDGIGESNIENHESSSQKDKTVQCSSADQAPSCSAESRGKKADSEDFFESDSEGSEESFSLLKDQEIIYEDDVPLTMPLVEDLETQSAEKAEQSDSEDKAENAEQSDSEDEDLIPGRQPESCPLEDLPERIPSPSIGRRVTRRSKTSQAQQPDLSALGPETQDIDCDSQGDPEYQPSQMVEDLDADDLTPQTRKSKRSSKKRQVFEEAVEAPKTRRRRK